MADNPYDKLVERNPYETLVNSTLQAEDRAAVGRVMSEDPGPIGAASIMAGQATDRIIQGAKSAALLGKKRFYEMRGDKATADAVQRDIDALRAAHADNQDVTASIQANYPTASALGSAAPYSVPIGGIVPSAIVGGTLGSLSAEPGQGMIEGGKQALLGGGGAMLGRGVLSAASPGQRVLDRNILTAPMTGDGGIIDRLRGFRTPDARGEILGNMEARGYRPYVSEIGGSTGARQAEDYLSRAPGSSGVMGDFAARNQRAINTSAAESIGERSRNLSADVLDRGSDRIGQTFGAVSALPGHPIGIGTDVNKAATEVLRLQGMRPISADPALNKIAQQLQTFSQHNGRITGEAYNALRSDLSSAASQAYRAGNSSAGRGYDDLLAAVDGSATSSLQAAGQGELAAQLATARGQYGNLMSLERGRTVTAAGDVNPQALSGTMRQKYPRAFREGNMEGNPLFDIARLGETYPPLRTGSQTFERQAIQDIAEAPAAMATGVERAGPSLMGVATAPFNWMGAQYMTSPVARFLSRRGLLGEPTTSFTTGVLSDAVVRDIVNGLPGSMGVVNKENWQ